MSKLLEFIFDRVGGKAVAFLLLTAGVFGWWQLDRKHQRDLGAANATTEINKQAGALAHEGEAARLDAEQPGALERLRKHSCRDC